MVVLDLFAEVKPIWPTSEQFYGIPYIWQVISYIILFGFLLSDDMPNNLDAEIIRPLC